MTSRAYPFETRVLIDGVEAYGGGPESRTGKPTILDGLSFTWGRTSNVDQPDVGTCTFTIREELRGSTQITSMLDLVHVDSSVEVWVDVLDGGAVVDSLLVWAGSVVSASGQAVGYTSLTVTVTAAEPAASLADETIGDTPWPVQTVGTRVARILELAQTDTAPITVDPTLTDFELTARDVDAQPVLPLLQDVAQSVGGVLWSAAEADQGAYLWLEDPSNRAALRQFLIDSTTGLVTITNNVPESGLLSAADVALDVQWAQDKTQAINSVDVTWERQGVDADGKLATSEVTETVTQPGAKIIRKLSVGTELINELDAGSLASRLFALVGSAGGWAASGLTIDTTVLRLDRPDFSYADRLEVVRHLLDGKARLGRPLTLVDLPEWAPGGTESSVYVEGGTYAITDGRWSLALDVSSPTGQGRSATFADFAGSGVKVSDFDPSITIGDAHGVAGPYTFAPGLGGGLFGDQAFGA